MSESDQACSASGVYKVFDYSWTVGACSCSENTHTLRIGLYDNAPPTIAHSGPASMVAEFEDSMTAADGSINVPYFDANFYTDDGLTATDNCHVETSKTISSSNSLCDNSFDVTYEFTASDTCSDATTSRTVQVRDTTSPSLLNAPKSGEYECHEFPVHTKDTVTFSEDPSELSFDVETTGDSCHASATFNWMWKDDCDNEDQYSITDIRRDTQPPSLALSGSLISSDSTTIEYVDDEVALAAKVQDAVDLFTSELDASYGDACSTHSVKELSQVITPNGCHNEQQVFRYTVCDACNNCADAEYELTIIIEDTTKPEWSGSNPDHFQVSETFDCGVPADFDITSLIPSVSGLGSSAPDMVILGPVSDVECANQGQLSYTVHQSDCQGNSISGDITLSYSDNYNPVLSSQHSSSVVDQCSIDYDFYLHATASDDCDSDVHVSSSYSTEFSCVTTATFHLSATDNCGKSDLHTFDVTTSIPTDPVFVDPPTDLAPVYECGAKWLGNYGDLFANDGCGASLGASPFTKADAGNSCLATSTLSWTATDCSSGSTSLELVATIQDTTPPTLIVDDNVVSEDETSTAYVECEADLASYSVPSSDSFDICQISEIDHQDDTADGVRTLSWKADDGCLESPTRTIRVLHNDTIAPVCTPLPYPSTVACADDFSITWMCEDNCAFINAKNPTYEETFTASQECDSNHDGVVSREYCFADDNGNSACYTVSFTIESVHPSLVLVEAGDGFYYPSLTPSSAPDCDIFAVTCSSDISGECEPDAYRNATTCTVSNACGHSDSDTVIVDVIDTEAPEIVDTSDLQDLSFECHNDVTAAPALFLSDNGVESLLTPAISSEGTCADKYTETRTWNGQDCSGNEADVVNQKVVVKDESAPSYIGDRTFAIECLAARSTPSDGVVADNCDASPHWSFDSSSTSSSSQHQVHEVITDTYIMEDRCGNDAQLDLVFTIKDTKDPTLTTSVSPDNNYECYTSTPNITFTATDECSQDVTTTKTLSATNPLNPQCECNSRFTYTVVASDGNGNQVSEEVELIRRDTLAPVWTSTIPADAIVRSQNDIPDAVTMTAADQISQHAVTVTQSSEIGDKYVVYTWEACDDCLNCISTSQNIWVNLNCEDHSTDIDCKDEFACGTLDLDTTRHTALTTFQNYLRDSTHFPGAVTDVSYVTASQDTANMCDQHFAYTFTVTYQDPTTQFASTTTADLEYSQNVFDEANPTFGGDFESQHTFQCAIGSTDPDAQDCDPNVDAQSADECVSYFDNRDTVCKQATRTWSLTDRCGLTAEKTQTLYAEVPTTKPSITSVVKDYVFECSPQPVDDPTGADACGGALQGHNEYIGDNGETLCNRVQSWKAVVSDASGLASDKLYTISVVDQDPTLTIPQDQEIECSGPTTLQEFLTNNPQTGSSSDDCDATQNVAGDCSIAGNAIECTFSRTDSCEQRVEKTQTITMIDTKKPSFDSDMTDSHSNCLLPSIPAPSFSDICDANVAIVSDDSDISEGCADSGFHSTITRTWTITDDAGNSDSDSRTFSASDTSAPSLAVSQDDNSVTFECGQEIPLLTALTASDDCKQLSAADVQVSQGSWSTDGLSGKQIKKRSWDFTVSDGCLSTSEQREQIVEDTKAPTFAHADETSTWECSPQLIVTQSADDVCQGSLVPDYHVTDAGTCSYTVVETWTATDDADNSATRQVTHNVHDTQAPTFDITGASIDKSGDVWIVHSQVSCGDDTPALDITNIQDCHDHTITQATEDNNNVCNSEKIITYTIEDECNNAQVVQHIVTFTDSAAPQPDDELDQDQSVEKCTDHSIPAWSWTDGCQGAIEDDVTMTTVSDSACMTELIYTSTAGDSCDNSDSRQQRVLIQDTTPPVWSPAVDAELTDVHVQCLEDLPSVLDLSAFASDCNQVTISHQQATSSLNDTALHITRTFTATDSCGIEADSKKVRKLTVYDTIAPSLSEPASASWTFGETVSKPCDSDWTPGTVTGDDNCRLDSVEISTSVAESACGRDGIKYTWTATDSAGNTKTEELTVSYIDTQPPSLIFNDDDDFVPPSYLALGSCDWADMPSYDVAMTDNCSPDNLTPVAPAQPAKLYLGVNYSRSWIAEDECGNKSNFTQVVEFGDKQAPVISFNGATELGCGDYDGEPVEDYTVTEDCSIATCSMKFNGVIDDTHAAYDHDFSPDCSETSFQYYQVYECCDETGNCDQVETLLYYSDTSPAVFVDSTPFYGEQDCPGPEPSIRAGIHACSETEFTATSVDVISNKQGNNWDVTRTWTFTDHCGREVTESVTFSIVDNEAPVVTSTKSYETSYEIDLYYDLLAMVDESDVTVADNCDEDPETTVTQKVETEGCPYNMTITRVYSSVDDNGNFAVVEESFQVHDSTPPVLHNIPQDIAQVELPNIDATIDELMSSEHPFNSGSDVFATDNSGAEVEVQFSYEIVSDDKPVGKIVKTWLVEDKCGNSHKRTQTIFFVDTTPPQCVWANDAQQTTYACDSPPSDSACEVVCTDRGQVIEPVSNGLTHNGEEYTRSYTVIDGWGNEATDSQVLTPIDEYAPQFSVESLANVEMECGCEDPPVPQVRATDNCHETQVNFQESFADSSSNTTIKKLITRTWIASEVSSDLSSSLNQVVTIVDTTPPHFTLDLPASITEKCYAKTSVPAIFAHDACDGVSMDLIVPTVQIGASSVCSATTSYSWTASDSAGLESSMSQTRIIIDDESPTFMERSHQLCVSTASGWTSSGTTKTKEIDMEYIFMAKDSCQEDLYLSNFESTTANVNANVLSNGIISSNSRFRVTIVGDAPNSISFQYSVNDGCPANSATGFRTIMVNPTIEEAANCDIFL